MDLSKMGKFIAQSRNKKGLTQKELAEKLGIGDKSVSKWERGVNAPDISLLQNICIELDISLNDLLNGENNSKEESGQIDAIKFYSLKSKNKIISTFTIIILLLVLIFTYIYDINNYKKFEMYNVRSLNEKVNINGYLVLNKKRNIIFINNIEYIDKFEGTEEDITNSMDIYLYVNNKIIYSYKYDLFEQNREEKITDILNKSYIYVNDFSSSKENKKIDEFNNMIILIKYQTKNIEKEIKIPIKVEK